MKKKIRFLGLKFISKLDSTAFTLVELIIVIAIISVLAVSAFMMLTKWLGSSRDSRRLADVETLNKSLSIWLSDLDNTNGILPEPDNIVDVTFDGTKAWEQGEFGENVTKIVDSIVKISIDPGTKNNYVYSRTLDKRHYQIATELEKNSTFMLGANVYAVGGINKVKGNFVASLNSMDLTGTTDCGVLYLPGIVVLTGYYNIEETNQYFVLDGKEYNLVNGGQNKKTFKEIMGTEKNLGVVWSGACNSNLFTDITTIVDNLSGMIITDSIIDNTYIEELLVAGGFEPEGSIVLPKYPGCDTRDMLIGGIEIAACNVGTDISGQAGDSIQFGRFNNTITDGTQSNRRDWKFPGGTDGGSANNWGIEETEKITAIFSTQSDSDKSFLKGPCANGYHVPTYKEWSDLIDAGGWGNDGTQMENDLYLYRGGYCDTNICLGAGSIGYFWTASPSGDNAYAAVFNDTVIGFDTIGRDGYMALRCFKDESYGE